MPIDYGTDLSALPDLDPMFPEVSGRAVLVEALARRFETPRGALFYDPDYGFDLRALIGEGFTDADVPQLQHEIAAECLKDERVQAARAIVGLNVQSGELRILLLLQDALGPFRRVLSIDSVSVTILNEDAGSGA